MLPAPRPLLALALALAAAACDPRAEPGERDSDGDGMPDGADCAPSDPSANELWQLYVDADGDGKGAGERVAVCRGIAAPAGYSDVGDDCDDSDAAALDVWSGYADDDRDGVGAGERLALCGGRAAPPRPLSLTTGDCAPADGGRWRTYAYLYRDADDDGVTLAREGVLCFGAQVDDGYTVVASGVDCDDADAARWLTIEGYADGDRDGWGSAPRVSLCTGGALPDGWVAVAGDCDPGDPLAWRSFTYAYRDADGDARTVAEAGTLCLGSSTPAGYLAVPSGADCDDGNRGIWVLRGAYADADGDQVGDGASTPVCSGDALPEGWATVAGDCAPADRSAWRNWAYAYRDADLDGRTIPEAGTLCIGAAPPGGYGNAAAGVDCDDGDETVWAAVLGYADGDEDRVGAGSAVQFCTDGALPAGYAASGTDCAPQDGGAWRLLAYSLADVDGDGFTAPIPAGQACAGATLPDPYRAVASGHDCDDEDASMYRAIVRYHDADGDGVGATPRKIFCVDADDEPGGYSPFGWDVDDANAAVDWDGADEELLLTVL